MRLLLLTIAFCLAKLATAQLAGPIIVDPYTYESPNKVFTLRVIPTNREGLGGAEYVLTKSGRRVWKKAFPFTLLNARISDAGVAFGTVYPAGPYAMGSGPDVLEIWMLDSKGDSHRLDSIPREYSGATDSPTVPTAGDLIFSEDQTQAIVVAHNRFNFRNSAAILKYDLRLQKRIAMVELHEAFGEDARHTELVDDTEVVGLPLLLTNWVVMNRPNEARTKLLDGYVYFKLVDADGKTKWSKEVDAELLYDSPANQFAYKIGNERYDFKVTKSGSNYTVTELGHKPYLEPASQSDLYPAPPTAPLHLVRTVTIPKVEPGTTIGIGKNRIAVARELDSGDEVKKSTRVEVYDFDQKLIFAHTLDPVYWQYRPNAITFDPNGTLCIGTELDNTTFSSNGERLSSWKAISDPLMPENKVAKYAGSSRRWVVDDTFGSISLVDRAGKSSRTIERDDDRWFTGIFEIDNAPDGSLAVLSWFGRMSSDRQFVAFFSNRGDHKSSFKVPSWVGNAYFLDCDKNLIVISGKNGVFGFDWSGKPLWRLDVNLTSAEGAIKQIPTLIDGENLLALDDMHGTFRLYKLPTHMQDPANVQHANSSGSPMVEIGGVDPDELGYVVKKLESAGIECGFQGSVSYSLYVRKSEVERAMTLLTRDKKIKTFRPLKSESPGP